MATRRRWLQFSLRGFFVVLTIGCICMGWLTERVIKRGRAINELAEAGAISCYGDDIYGRSVHLRSKASRLWNDFVGTPVRIGWFVPLKKKAAAQLPNVYGLRQINMWGLATDDDLRCLEGTDAETILIVEPRQLTKSGKERLERSSPNATILYDGENFDRTAALRIK